MGLRPAPCAYVLRRAPKPFNLNSQGSGGQTLICPPWSPQLHQHESRVDADPRMRELLSPLVPTIHGAGGSVSSRELPPEGVAKGVRKVYVLHVRVQCIHTELSYRISMRMIICVDQ